MTETNVALDRKQLENAQAKFKAGRLTKNQLLVVQVALQSAEQDLESRGSWFALFWTTLPFVLSSLSIGVFVSTLVHTSAQAVFITVFFMLPSFVLSGVMIPYRFMPPGIRRVGAILPLRWYQIALRRIIGRGGGFAETAVPAGAMLLIFAGLLLLIRWRMKPRLG